MERIEHLNEAIDHLEESETLMRDTGYINQADTILDIIDQLNIIKGREEAAHMAAVAECARDMMRDLELERGCR